MDQLKTMGSPQTASMLAKHGAPENMFGVKVADLKKILKRIKNDQAMAEALFDTGNGDAMYLATLAADARKATPELLTRWAESSTWYMVNEYGIAGVAAEGPHGWSLGLTWIESDLEQVATTGWATLAGVVAVAEDDELDHQAISALLDRVAEELHRCPNRVRYTMNGFVIGVGCYVPALSAKARQIGEQLGKVKVDMGGTACKVPSAPEYIDKVVQMGRLGKKRKTVRC
ncbi:MAG: DNA alkylation repair protein [Acidobacteria bacterium]|nr:DNA alkylation repair protein [Acidobacteriota bacterium]